MKKLTRSVSVAALLGLFVSGCTMASGFSEDDIATFQPTITTMRAPERPLRSSYSLYNNTERVGLAPMMAHVPAFNGQGLLLASWNPHPRGADGRPTFIVMHGGHGLTPTNFANALWLKRTFEANVLVLDSYWSRGREENWATWTPFGVNMRALDAIAAARWLRETQKTDPRKTFILGDSQGGWTVLRTFTDEPFFTRYTRDLLAGGIALYPNCAADGSRFKPRLSPYALPVIVFTGGRDTATPVKDCAPDTLSRAERWVHYPDQTHGWDVANRGAHTPSVDGECGKAMNVYNQFPVCRSDATTSNMYREIETFISLLIGR